MDARSDWQRSLIILTTVVVGAAIIGGLYWGRDLFIPLALAILLTFVLSPVVNAFCRVGLHRVVAVLVVLSGITMFTLALGVFVASQSSTLIQDLPAHSENLRQRIKSIKSNVSSESSKRFQKFVDEMWGEVTGAATPSDEEDKTVWKESKSQENENEPSPEQLTNLLTILFASTAGALGTLALTVLLAAFMLVSREDLRDRFIRLIGDDRVATTTKAMDDAGKRISRFLFAQFVVNTAYGVVLGISLALVGVPYAALWGVIGAVMRYIPYVGPWVAAVAPMIISISTSPDWTQPMLAGAVIVGLELVLNNFVEPYAFGSSIGVSQVAFIVFAAFWGYLWGAVGLILAAPLTVVLLVIGQRVPHLSALNTLLGEDTPLQPHIRLFQRLIARDADEGTRILSEAIENSSPIEACDQVLLPALNQLTESVISGEIDESEYKRANQQAAEIIDVSLERTRHSHADLAPSVNSVKARPTILLIPIDSDYDSTALHAMEHFVDPLQWDIKTPESTDLVSEVLAFVEEASADVVCLVGLETSGHTHVRYTCKRLQTLEADHFLLVVRLGNPSASRAFSDAYLELGVSAVVHSLSEVQALLSSRLHLSRDSDSPAETKVPASSIS